MAKCLLWFFVILDFIVLLVSYYSDNPSMEMFPRILLFSILGVLAICESIEKTKS